MLDHRVLQRSIKSGSRFSTQVTRLECYSEAAGLSQVFPHKLQGSSATVKQQALRNIFHTSHKSLQFNIPNKTHSRN